MKFKVSKDGILKEKNKPIYTIILAIIIMLAIILLPQMAKQKEIDWIAVAIFATGVIIMVVSSIFGAYKIIDELKKTTLEIKDDGIYLHTPQGINIVPFEMVKSVKLKYKNNEIKKFTLKTNGKITYNYLYFENLDELDKQLKKHLDKNLWL